MVSHFAAALSKLVKEALPGVFGGEPPAVTLAITTEEVRVTPDTAEAKPGAPRADDRRDELPFDAAHPSGPYTLTQEPYPGPRRVRLLMDAGARITLREEEVRWQPDDPRRFTLALRPSRDVDHIAAVQVLYGVTAVFANVMLDAVLHLRLRAADAAELERGAALLLGFMQLNAQTLVDVAQATYADGVYQVGLETKAFALEAMTTPPEAADTRLFRLRAQVAMKVTRTLADHEGAPIRRIVSGGQTASAARPVNIQIDVEG